MTRDNRVDVHPEDLLDAAYRGELDEPGRQRLNQHMAYCTSCRLEHGLIDDIAAETAEREGDAAHLDAVVAAALGTAATRAASTSLAARSASWAPRRVAWLTGGALLVGAFGGAAAAWWAMAPPEPTAVDAPASPATEEPGVEADLRERRATDPDPTVAEEDVEDAPAPIPEAEPPIVTRPSAAELLARANEARRDGEARGAVRRYRELQSMYPRSPEAQLSHVALGRLFLDRLDDPGAALSQFDRYLTAPGTLAEEARVGRALALMRLGRPAEERRAWQDLLDHHPSSPHADRARARIEP